MTNFIFILAICITLQLLANPSIKSIVPPSGPASENNLITIYGDGFTDCVVHFGDQTLEPLAIKDKEITVMSPKGTPKVLEVRVGSSQPGYFTLQGEAPVVSFAAVSPDGSIGYILNKDSIDVIDVATNLPKSPFPTTSPQSMAILDTKGYIANGKSILVLDLSNPAMPNVIGNIETSNPSYIALASDGTKAFICNIHGNPITSTAEGVSMSKKLQNGTVNFEAGSITILDTQNDTILSTISHPSISSPSSITISQDQTTAQVVNNNTLVTITNPLDNPLFGAPTPLTAQQEQQLTLPDQAPLALFTAIIKPYSVIQFDGTMSLSPTGTIASWTWDFGDGISVTEHTGKITHRFKEAKMNKVTLTVTNSQGTSTSKVYANNGVSHNGGPTAQLQLMVRSTPRKWYKST